MTFEETLRHELDRAAATIPTRGVDLHRTLTRGRQVRRRRRLVTALASTAVAAIVAGSATMLLTTSQSKLSDDPVAPAQTGVTPHEKRSPLEEEVDLDQVEAVLREWLAAIQDGDEDRAWDLMTPEAQAVLGRQEFDRMMASELPEGLGAFADAPSFHYVVVDSTEKVAEVVGVVSGEVTREGSTEFAVIAIPMRATTSETLVDDSIVDRARYYEREAVFASVSAGPLAFHSGDDLIIDFADPSGATDAFVSIDAYRRPLPTDFDPTTGEAVATLDRDLEQGRHVAIVIVRHETGRLYAESILFQAAAP